MVFTVLHCEGQILFSVLFSSAELLFTGYCLAFIYNTKVFLVCSLIKDLYLF